MTKITTDHPSSNWYYLPHHGVIKESSDITKLKVVFGGSAPSTTGVSLRYSSYRIEVTRGSIRHSNEIPLASICPNGRY
jgi:hypothetical protein